MINEYGRPFVSFVTLWLIVGIRTSDIGLWTWDLGPGSMFSDPNSQHPGPINDTNELVSK